MNLNEFLEHVNTHSKPEAGWTPALQALWLAEKGEWEQAHDRCQQGDSAEGAWVHANLHREEGDLANARYWYARAGKPECEDGIREERHDLIAELLVNG